MEDVLNKLSEIEITASKIMEDVNTQKKELADRMDADMMAYDEQVDAVTHKKLEEIRRSLEVEKESRVTELNNKTQEFISYMDTYYEEHHLELVQKIYDKLLRM